MRRKSTRFLASVTHNRVYRYEAIRAELQGAIRSADAAIGDVRRKVNSEESAMAVAENKVSEALSEQQLLRSELSREIGESGGELNSFEEVLARRKDEADMEQSAPAMHRMFEKCDPYSVLERLSSDRSSTYVSISGFSRRRRTPRSAHCAQSISKKLLFLRNWLPSLKATLRRQRKQANLTRLLLTRANLASLFFTTHKCLQHRFMCIVGTARFSNFGVGTQSM